MLHSHAVLAAGAALLSFGVLGQSCNLYEGRAIDLFPGDVAVLAECNVSAECPAQRPACARGACVECVVDADCGGMLPACVGNVCVACRIADHCANRQSCNSVLNECSATCAEQSDCAGQPATQCSPELGLCVQCLEDADCQEPRSPACDRGGRCVECLADVHCPPDRPSCNGATRRCAECLDSSQCDGRVCDARDGKCVECLSDADCALGTCDTGPGRCRIPCAAPADCGPGKPMCEATSGSCVECLGDEACTDPKRPACSADHQCVQCTSDAHCGSPGKPACIVATGRCGECSRDEHCPGAQRCDLAAARCAPIPATPVLDPAAVPDAGSPPRPGMSRTMAPPPAP